MVAVSVVVVGRRQSDYLQPVVLLTKVSPDCFPVSECSNAPPDCFPVSELQFQ